MLGEIVLHDLIKELGWRPIPESVITREGAEIKTDTSIWLIPLVSNGGETLRFRRINNAMLRWAAQMYTIHRLETVSMNAGWKVFNALAQMLGADSNALASITDSIDFKEPLIEYFERLVGEARAAHKLWTLWEIIQWYIWCAERYPELGLHLTTRRLRYTLATNLASEGVSKQELARILDHSDTQHVGVYYEMAGRIVEHLDKATAKAFSGYLNAFKGRPIESDKNAVNGGRQDKRLAYFDDATPHQKTDIGVCGEAALCHQDPPFSCYLCPKFQPYLSADHNHVLESLLAAREMRLHELKQQRIGIQLDEVIYAVAQVAKVCEERKNNV